MKVIDPVEFVSIGWPHITLYKEQKEIMYSVHDNDETVVTAGHQLGKDFIAALITLWFFCSRRPSRVVTTSVKHDQLNHVLWGEIRNFVDTCKINLPIDRNYMELRQVDNQGQLVPKCEVTAQVAKQGESLAGYHLPRTGGIARTLAVFDEASGIPDSTYKSVDTWAHKILIIGNPYPCKNFFFRAVKGGDLTSPQGHYYRRVMKIRAQDSPNVKLAERQIELGRTPTNEEILPGVKSYPQYAKHRELWDKVKQTVGLDGEFYEGDELKMFPSSALDRSSTRAQQLEGVPRIVKAMGIDTAEGGDKTCWTGIDEWGVIFLESMLTPDTSIIPDKTIELIEEHDIPHNMVNFDAGGGGKQHADQCRRRGYNVKTTAFGSKAKAEIRRGVETLDSRKDRAESNYVYRNVRSQMFHELSLAVNPIDPEDYPFAIPDHMEEYREQLEPIPIMYDGEGIIWLPPKNKKDPNSNVQTLIELIGHSPDEADSLVLAYHALKHHQSKRTAGVAF